MKIGIFSDIHSNLEALKAVIAALETERCDFLICTGDLIGYGPYPNEVIKEIREKNILTIMGNNEEDVFEMSVMPQKDNKPNQDTQNEIIDINFNRKQIINDYMDYLRNLPRELILDFGNKKIRFVHGSPRKIDEHLYENSKEAEEVMNQITEDILVCSHTHFPYAKWYGNKLLINTGTVGRPKDGNKDADYVILMLGAEAENKSIRVPESVKLAGTVNYEFKTAQYDTEKTASAIKRMGLPKEFAQPSMTGKV